MLRVDKTQQNTEPDNNSDVDYIMPRVCFQFLSFIHKIIFLLFIHFKSILGIWYIIVVSQENYFQSITKNNK